MRPGFPSLSGALGYVVLVWLPMTFAAPSGAATTVTLAMGAGPDTVTLSRAWSHRAVDVGLVLDLTGSMTGELTALKNGFSSVAASLQAAYPDVRVGVAEFEDWPCGNYGSAALGDLPFRLVQRCTSNMSLVQSAVNGLAIHFGGDGPESGYEAIHQAVSGTGATSSSCGVVPAFDASAGLVAGVADGSGGGMGFRSGVASQVIVVSTDADFHESTDYTFTGPVSRATTLAELQASGARFAAILSTDGNFAGALTQLRELCTSTGSIAAVGYGATSFQCDNGINGSGTAPVNGGCPNVFQMLGNGSGFGTALLFAVRSALDGSPFTLSTSLVGAALPPGGTSADFVQSSVFTGGTNPAFAPAPTVSGGGATLLGSFATGTADLRIVLENQSVPGSGSVQTYPLVVETRAQGTVVARDTIVIEVPRPLDVEPATQTGFRLAAASRNPSAGRFGFRLSMPVAGDVRLTVCDAAGRRVRALESGARSPGSHVLVWDGAGDDGNAVPAGLYFVRADWGDRHTSLRVTQLR